MRRFKNERFYIQFCKDSINGDFFSVYLDGIDYEMSPGHVRQLLKWLNKILSGLKPREIKFRKHALAGPPHFYQENKHISCMGTNTEVWFNTTQIKRLCNWLKYYEKV